MNAQTAQIDEAQEAHDRARRSNVILIRVSPRKYAIARITGNSAHGIQGSKRMYGVRSATVLKECKNLSYQEAQDWMKEFDLGAIDPSDLSTV